MPLASSFPVWIWTTPFSGNLRIRRLIFTRKRLRKAERARQQAERGELISRKGIRMNPASLANLRPCLITPKHPAYVSIRKIFRQIAALYHEEVPGYELALKGLFLQVIFLLLQYSTKQAKNVLPEEGTPAAEMEDQIDEEVKKQRRDAIMELQQEISFDFEADCVGEKLLVMIEGYLPDEHAYVGRTYMDAPGIDGYIFIKSGEALMSGDFAEAVVTGSDEYDLIGELYEEHESAE